MAKSKTTIAFKGFDKNMKCRDYQFSIGKKYKHEGEVKACASGFHSCEYPLDIFKYYNPCTSMFALVEVSGAISKDGDDSKIASEKIHVKKELGLAELIQEAINYTISKTDPAVSSTNSGTRGASTNSGYGGASTNSGYGGASTNSGTRGASTNSGTRGASTNSGEYGASTNSGEYGASTNSGYGGASTNSGEYGVSANFAYEGKARGCNGTALFLVERDSDWKILNVWAGIVGQGDILADVFYKLVNGVPVAQQD